MRIYVFKLKNVIICISLVILCTIIFSLIGITGIKAIGVAAISRDLPIYSVETKEKKASITFDCAWGADDIPSILDTLEKENVKATFFIVGLWAEKFPETVKLIANKGHDIANHSYSHIRLGAVDNQRIKEEIVKCNQVLEKLTGNKVELFRAPYGDYNNSVVAIARKEGCYTIQWNLDSLDWRPNITQEEIINRVTKRIEPGSIILFHNDTPHTAKLLPAIIATLKKEGYSFVPVSELIMRDNYYIDNEGRQKRKGL
ncbi:MAG TPA: polysaccharide deacetylase family protein [Clostridiaceae bacterium]|nr:polysaccharide deacetylase family protein [Clostridiaceae bacterium]